MLNRFTIIDRRVNGNGKAINNRKRFLDKHRDQIDKQVRDAVNRKSITDTDGENIIIRDSLDEPNFSWDFETGEFDRVYGQNPGYNAGDLVEKDRSGKGSSRKAGRGESQDEFRFYLTREEYLDILFGDLELPKLLKRNHTSSVVTERMRTGYSTDGPTSLLDLKRTFKNSICRKLALTGSIEERIKELLLEYESNPDPEIMKEIELLEASKTKIAYIDDVDLRYKRYSEVNKPITKAVVFFVMDVSGSMSAKEKEIAKRFFLLNYLFLTRSYKEVEIVFVRHTDEAWECDEDEFFYSTQSGGTLFSPAVELISKIVSERYPLATHNIYTIMVSDGDNDETDNIRTKELLDEFIPKNQFYIYIETPTGWNKNKPTSRDMWTTIDDTYSNFCFRIIEEVSSVLDTFRDIYAKDTSKLKKD